jgi:type IV secretory pathway TraG/TraD family ATPase VirD4
MIISVESPPNTYQWFFSVINFLLKIIDFFSSLLFRIKSNSSTWFSSDSHFFFLAIRFVIILCTTSTRERERERWRMNEWMNEWLVVQVLKYAKEREGLYINTVIFSIIIKRKMKKKSSVVTSACERANSR